MSDPFLNITVVTIVCCIVSIAGWPSLVRERIYAARPGRVLLSIWFYVGLAAFLVIAFACIGFSETLLLFVPDKVVGSIRVYCDISIILGVLECMDVDGGATSRRPIKAWNDTVKLWRERFEAYVETLDNRVAREAAMLTTFGISVALQVPTFIAGLSANLFGRVSCHVEIKLFGAIRKYNQRWIVSLCNRKRRAKLLAKRFRDHLHDRRIDFNHLPGRIRDVVMQAERGSDRSAARIELCEAFVLYSEIGQVYAAFEMRKSKARSKGGPHFTCHLWQVFRSRRIHIDGVEAHIEDDTEHGAGVRVYHASADIKHGIMVEVHDLTRGWHRRGHIRYRLTVDAESVRIGIAFQRH